MGKNDMLLVGIAIVAISLNIGPKFIPPNSPLVNLYPQLQGKEMSSRARRL